MKFQDKSFTRIGVRLCVGGAGGQHRIEVEEEEREGQFRLYAFFTIS